MAALPTTYAFLSVLDEKIPEGRGMLLDCVCKMLIYRTRGVQAGRIPFNYPMTNLRGYCEAFCNAYNIADPVAFFTDVIKILERVAFMQEPWMQRCYSEDTIICIGQHNPGSAYLFLKDDTYSGETDGIFRYYLTSAEDYLLACFLQQEMAIWRRRSDEKPLAMIDLTLFFAAAFIMEEEEFGPFVEPGGIADVECEVGKKRKRQGLDLFTL